MSSVAYMTGPSQKPSPVVRDKEGRRRLRQNVVLFKGIENPWF